MSEPVAILRYSPNTLGIARTFRTTLHNCHTPGVLVIDGWVKLNDVSPIVQITFYAKHYNRTEHHIKHVHALNRKSCGVWFIGTASFHEDLPVLPIWLYDVPLDIHW